MTKRMINTDKDFYKYMGQIFGSREVQRDTGDRFYDDDDKEWVIDVQNKTIMSVISIKNYTIKNVYANDVFSLIDVLKCVHSEVFDGTVPILYREAYAAAGYKIMEEKKNFLKIKGGKVNEWQN